MTKSTQKKVTQPRSASPSIKKTPAKKSKSRGPEWLLYVQGCKDSVRKGDGSTSNGRCGTAVHSEINRQVEKDVELRVRIAIAAMLSCGRTTLKPKDIFYASGVLGRSSF